jgi:hypothetical protein
LQQLISCDSPNTTETCCYCSMLEIAVHSKFQDVIRSTVRFTRVALAWILYDNFENRETFIRLLNSGIRTNFHFQAGSPKFWSKKLGVGREKEPFGIARFFVNRQFYFLVE